MFADVPAAGRGLGPVGEIRLLPDLQTLTMLPYAAGHAQFMGDMMLGGRPWPCCPRYFVKRMIAKAGVADLTIMAAFENEFYLLHTIADRIVPADRTVFAATHSMELQREVIEAIVDALTAQGITVEQYYPESGPGQQELSMGYGHALGRPIGRLSSGKPSARWAGSTNAGLPLRRNYSPTRPAAAAICT